MTGELPPPPPPPPPRVPPVLAPPLPRARRFAPAPPRPPASPRKRFLVGLAASAAFAAVGTFLLVGLPGVVPLAIANTVLGVVRGTDPMKAMRESAWGAALVVTLLSPVPFAPALAFFTFRNPTGPPARHVILAGLVAFAWATVVAFAVLLAA
jgi:hypothetical protein